LTITPAPPSSFGARSDHPPRRLARARERAAQVDRHDPVPDLVGHVEQQDIGIDAGIVDPDIERAELAHRPIGESGDRSSVGHIEVSRAHCAAIGLGEFRRCLFGKVEVEIADQQRGPCFGQPPGDALAQPLRPAGDNRAAPFKRKQLGERLSGYVCYRHFGSSQVKQPPLTPRVWPVM
jgi:hypothetical protein